MHRFEVERSTKTCNDTCATAHMVRILLDVVSPVITCGLQVLLPKAVGCIRYLLVPEIQHTEKWLKKSVKIASNEHTIQMCFAFDPLKFVIM